MTYSIRIERNEGGTPVIAWHAGQLPGTIVISGHEDESVLDISAALVDTEEHQVLTAHAQRPPRLAETWSS